MKRIERREMVMESEKENGQVEDKRRKGKEEVEEL